jgi:DNA-directed RNA polymerase specialized sigma24 family protein
MRLSTLLPRNWAWRTLWKRPPASLRTWLHVFLLWTSANAGRRARLRRAERPAKDVTAAFLDGNPG